MDPSRIQKVFQDQTYQGRSVAATEQQQQQEWRQQQHNTPPDLDFQQQPVQQGLAQQHRQDYGGQQQAPPQQHTRMSPAAANHISNSPLPINHTPDNPSEPDVVGGVGRQRVTDDKQPRIMKNTNDNTNLHQQHDLRTDGWLDMAHYHQLQQQQQQQNWPDYYSTGVICNWPFATPQQVIMPPFDNSSWQANTAAAENMSGGPPSYAGWPSTRRRHSSQHDDESTAAAAVEQQSLTHHHHPAPPWSFGGGAFTRDQGLVRRAAPRHSSNSSDVETAPFSAGWYHGVVTEQQQQQPRTVQRPVNLFMPPVDGGEPSAGPVHRHADQHRQFASPAVVAQHAYTQQQGRSAGLGADDAGARYYQPYSSPGIKMGSTSGVRNDEQACGVDMSQVEPTTMGAVSPSAASPARIVHQQPRNQQPAVQHKATPTAMAAVPNTTDLLDVASIGLLPPAVVDGQQQSNEQQQQQQQQFLRSIGQTTVPAALTTTPAGKRMSGKTPTSRNPSSTRSRRGGGRSRMSAEVGRIARTKAAGKRVRPQHLLDALEQQVSDLTASKGQLEIKLSEKCTAVHFTANAISAKTAEIYNMKLRNLSLEEHDVTGCNPSALTCNSQPALRDLPHKHEPPGPKFKDAVKGLSQLMNHFLKSTGKQKGELEANIETHVGVLVRALMERCCSTSGEAYAGWVNATTEESVSGGHGALEHHPSQYIEAVKMDERQVEQLSGLVSLYLLSIESLLAQREKVAQEMSLLATHVQVDSMAIHDWHKHLLRSEALAQELSKLNLAILEERFAFSHAFLSMVLSPSQAAVCILSCYPMHPDSMFLACVPNEGKQPYQPGPSGVQGH